MFNDKSRGKPIKNPLPIIKDYRVRGKETPMQNQVREVIINNPNCTVGDIYKALPTVEQGGIRRAIRKMVESHRIIQRFTIP